MRLNILSLCPFSYRSKWFPDTRDSEALQDAGDSVSSDAAKQLKGMKASMHYPMGVTVRT